ncbi:hypothetical protein RI367_002235 [Sorochytrium milnesiophthora]
MDDLLFDSHSDALASIPSLTAMPVAVPPVDAAPQQQQQHEGEDTSQTAKKQTGDEPPVVDAPSSHTDEQQQQQQQQSTSTAEGATVDSNTLDDPFASLSLLDSKPAPPPATTSGGGSSHTPYSGSLLDLAEFDTLYASSTTAAAPSSSTDAAPTTESTTASDPFAGFAAFAEPVQHSTDSPQAETAPPANPPAADDDNGFGDFTATTSPSASGAGGGGFDADFGDFGDFTSTGNQGTLGADGDDGFGDFGDFGSFTTSTDTSAAPTAFGALSEPPPVVEAKPALAAASMVSVDGVDYAALIANMSNVRSLSQNRTTVLAEVNKLLRSVAPLGSADKPSLGETLIGFSESLSEDGDIIRRTVANPAFEGEPWHALWTDLAASPAFDEHISTKVRWKKSNIRKLFLKSLDVTVEEVCFILDGLPPSVRATDNLYQALDRADRKLQRSRSNMSVNTVDSQSDNDADVGRAATPTNDANARSSASTPSLSSPMSPLPNFGPITALCELSEDDLNAKSVDELQSIQSTLAHAVPRLTAQINYYLDAKEQLSMDSEMHNKVISVLVQQAQKAHQMNAQKGGSPPKTSSASRSRRGTGAGGH